jgi:hypothetical protein
MTARRRALRLPGNRAYPYDDDGGKFAFWDTVFYFPDNPGHCDLLPNNDAEGVAWEASLESYMDACYEWGRAVETLMAQPDKRIAGRRRTATGWDSFEEEIPDGFHEETRPVPKLRGDRLAEELNQLGGLDELHNCVVAGRHRNPEQVRLYTRLALYVALERPVVTSVARRLDISRPAVYQLRRKGDEIVTVLEKLETIEKLIDQRFDEQTTIILNALGLRPAEWAEDLLADTLDRAA